ncbi:MAG: SOS response-associated peptidase [Candidatus Latescibacteria bacterium]|nr:SOS response-associated peptidase [Candidatus Latescibacterota bacterium]
MCGRFAIGIPPFDAVKYFNIEELVEFTPRYNVAPTEFAPVIIKREQSNKREIKMFRWGLIPPWSKDVKIGFQLINARAETVAEKPAFRSAFKNRRCLIPATGFYEWKKYDGKKQPMFIRMQDEKPFTFAGIWETWKAYDHTTIESFSIITTQSNDLLKEVHDRMPVILQKEDYDVWLDSEKSRQEELQSLLKPYPPDLMTFYRVESYVNDPQYEGPECIKQIFY